MPNISLKASDGVTTFTSYNFGNLLTGAASSPQLAFCVSDGSGTASGAKFGTSQVSGSDGYTFTEVVSGNAFNASGTNIAGSAASGTGTISGTASLRYALTVKDSFEHESYIDTVTYSPSLTSGTNTFTVAVSWTAISGASLYGLYLSLDSGATYGRVTYTAATSYVDTSGTSGTGSLPASGSTAYRPSGTWVSYTSYLDLGDMASGTTKPVFYRENLPSGTTSANNPRQLTIYTSYLA